MGPKIPDDLQVSEGFQKGFPSKVRPPRTLSLLSLQAKKLASNGYLPRDGAPCLDHKDGMPWQGALLMDNKPPTMDVLDILRNHWLCYSEKPYGSIWYSDKPYIYIYIYLYMVFWETIWPFFWNWHSPLNPLTFPWFHQHQQVRLVKPADRFGRIWAWWFPGEATQFILVGGETTPPKNMSSSVGMMKFPTEWKVIKFMFQTTNQYNIVTWTH